ncbi:MAG: hypothetical protein ABFC56_16360 [Clostridiaceae bacterium]
MKKAAPFLLALIFLFVGCSSSQSLQAEETIASSGNISAEKQKEFKVIHAPFEDWMKYKPAGDGIYSDLVATETCALAIANAIIGTNLTDDETCTYPDVRIWEDVEEGVWVISYYPQSTDPDFEIAGGDIHIVIRKHDGQVASYWGGE